METSGSEMLEDALPGVPQCVLSQVPNIDRVEASGNPLELALQSHGASEPFVAFLMDSLTLRESSS
jgi:hypothetical protein